MRLFILLLMISSVYPLLIPEKHRQKRFIDIGKFFKSWTDTVSDVQRNAEIRMDAEQKNIKPIEYAQPVLPVPKKDPFQTNFNPGDQAWRNRYLKVLYMSMSTTPMEHNGPLVTETVPRGFKQDQFNSKTKHKRSADVQSYDPSRRLSILGKDSRSSVTHYQKVDNSKSLNTVSIAKQEPDVESKATRISRRSTQDNLDLNDPQLADKIIAESSNPQEALAKMLDAEKKIDSVLHKVLGDVHESDNKDLATIEKMIGKSVSKRAAEENLEKAIGKSVESVASATKMLTQSNQEDKALEEIMKADRELTAMLEALLPPGELEKSKKSRAKREQSVNYYDPEYLWLMNHLNLSPEDGQEIQQIVYGESARGSPQTTFTSGTPQAHETLYSRPSSYTPPSQYGSQPWVPYDNKGRQNKMEDESSWFSFLDSFRPIADSVPLEVDAAYRGALDVGKHVTKKVRPYVSHGYNKVTKEILPQASKTVSGAISDDIKDFARQGRKIVESRARTASQAAEPHLENLKNDLWLLQAQIKQVADETAEYTKKEIVPNIGPTIQGLLFDVQETLELASQMVETDLKPLVKKVSDSVIKPAYSTVSSRVVSPAASTVKDYVVRPVAETVVDYVVKPVAHSAQPVVDYVAHSTQPVVDYATPVYNAAQNLASSGMEGARVTYHNVRPTIQDFTYSTQQVLQDRVAPTVQVAASQVADGASRLGTVIQSDVVPQVQQGVSSTLHGLFTGIPSLVKKVSSEANDAAKIFSNRYRQALEELRSKAEIQRKEQEAKLNLIRKEMHRVQEQFPAEHHDKYQQFQDLLHHQQDEQDDDDEDDTEFRKEMEILNEIELQQKEIENEVEVEEEMQLLEEMKQQKNLDVKKELKKLELKKEMKEMKKKYDAVVKAVITDRDNNRLDDAEVSIEKVEESVEVTTPKEL